jgi:hypothetical protein
VRSVRHRSLGNLLMSPLRARRLGVLTTALLTVGLLAPTAVSAAPTGSAATLGLRGSEREATVSAMQSTAATGITIRDLSFACPDGVPRAPFTDMPSGGAFSREVDCLVWYEITAGKTPTTYAPTSTVTRQQMAVFLYRLLEHADIPLPPAPTKSAFRDVPATGEAGRAINILASAELAAMLDGERLVTGVSSNLYNPAGTVSRAQMGSFIARFLRGVAAYGGAEFTDGHCGDPSRPYEGCFVDERLIPSVHRGNVAELYQFGVVAGRGGGKYDPGSNVTRGQMSAFLMRLTDVLAEARLVYTPDAFQEVFVDRGNAVAPCSNTGRDGSEGKPFCTIQAAIQAAGQRTRKVVDVIVIGRDGQPAYAENVTLASGKAYEINLYGDHASGDLVDIAGSVTIAGDAVDDYNLVASFRVDGATAFHVGTKGAAVLVDVETLGSGTGVRVDQDGEFLAAYSWLASSTTSLDVVRTYEAGAIVTDFLAATDAYVVLPAGTTSTRATEIFYAYFLDPELENIFDLEPVEATLPSGRRALTPKVL